MDLPPLQRFVDRLAADGAGRGHDHHGDHAAARDLQTRPPAGRGQAGPITGVSLPSVLRRQERFATTAQVEALIGRLGGVKDRALWATAIYAGLRRGELRALRREDVDLATGVIHLRRGWDAVEGEVAPKSAQGAAGCRSLPRCATGWPST